MSIFKKAKETRYKGRKIYAIMREGSNDTYYESPDIEYAKRGLDSDFNILVEMTITRVFTRERDLKEIELDPLN